MTAGTAQKISNAILSCGAGAASFLFSLTALLYLTEFDQKLDHCIWRRTQVRNVTQADNLVDAGSPDIGNDRL